MLCSVSLPSGMVWPICKENNFLPFKLDDVIIKNFKPWKIKTFDSWVNCPIILDVSFFFCERLYWLKHTKSPEQYLGIFQSPQAVSMSFDQYYSGQNSSIVMNNWLSILPSALDASFCIGFQELLQHTTFY